MRPELHPDAANNFDERARVLLAAVAPESRREPSEPPIDIFRPGRHVVASFDEGDYLEFKITRILSGVTSSLLTSAERYLQQTG